MELLYLILRILAYYAILYALTCAALVLLALASGHDLHDALTLAAILAALYLPVGWVLMTNDFVLRLLLGKSWNRPRSTP